MRTILLVLATLLLAPAASADEQPVTLKNAPGRDVVEGNCGACHSLDYIQTNSPFPSAGVIGAPNALIIFLTSASHSAAEGNGAFIWM